VPDAHVEAIEFETRRLRLRRWRDADRDPFAALNADPVVMEYFPSALDRAASDEMIDRFEAAFDERGWSNWAVEVRESGDFIGFIGLSIPRLQFPFSPCVEIGWRLARPHWGKGYASEGARGVLRVGFERIHLPEILSWTSVINRRSRAVMERIGLSDTRENFEHPGIPEGHALRPHCLYRIKIEEWRAGPGRE
jgi:RimJ/RimL family protein N-acetyltransferase